MKTTRSSPFTLLELFICISIIALVGALFGHKSYQALKSAKIRSAKKHLHLNIQRCHKLAIAHQSDWTLILTEIKGGLQCEMISDTEYKKEWVPKLSLGPKMDQQLITFTSTGLVFPSQIDIDDGASIEEFLLERDIQRLSIN